MREVDFQRKTNETNINLKLNLDGSGKCNISTKIPFFDHMLNAFTKHSQFDLQLSVIGDIEIDYHHTIEDTGIALGEAFRMALGEKRGIYRFGEATLPLDEALSRVVLDISGRSYLFFGVVFMRCDDGSNINPYLFEEFFRGFANASQMTLHIDSIRGNNSHHVIESIFKAFAKAIQKAIKIDGNEIPSTKGVL
ncbi:MAG: imidazoleglycerol-phosphate dehydratase [Spirochaetes bacterium GWD1_27_9]|nr:MAG: imidazoleglycerol-phosphate dehydratase [Spirochaetes bacterium GWB1_27_13]OHD25384.1 MAG: imidazoleglycerol-phosphate dehydratase [Spirochaetes bacterium GWC1_27_15]OHD30296.1 MAG: imidazoleglycerol-phosphate dehydratase [Spirochaetes bacterium GWD1_27_9]